MVVIHRSAEARATGDLAIFPIVIRRTDVLDEVATTALVKPLGHVVLDEFLDQTAQMSLAENDELAQALGLYGKNKSRPRANQGTSNEGPCADVGPSLSSL
jgi:hypothetical protein